MCVVLFFLGGFVIHSSFELFLAMESKGWCVDVSEGDGKVVRLLFVSLEWACVIERVRHTGFLPICRV